MNRNSEKGGDECRKIEVFTAGCPACAEAVQLVEFLAGTEHDIEIRDIHDPAVAAAALLPGSAGYITQSKTIG